MIPARKNAWFERLFAVYNRNLLARRFEGLRVAGLEHLRNRPTDAPLLLYANHSSWWDGLVAFQLGRASALAQYVLMEERQLKAYPLFRRLGAFSIERQSAREALRSIEYAASLLRGTTRALWIFPQGETFANDTRPLKLYAGAARIIERAGTAYAAPVAMRYEFLGDFRPEAFARVGALEPVTITCKPEIKDATKRFADALTRTLDAVCDDILQARMKDYEEIVAPRRRRKSQISKALGHGL
jgi:1-acyl-sn-glycerol-3-phosphate acyltransferase